MRKLSKKISMLMVLAMLVSLFSGVVSASAASSWTFFNKTKEDSIVAQSKTETYKMENNEFADFDMFKDGKTIDTKVYTVKYGSSDADVVFVDAKNGKLRAKGEAGESAKVTAYITNKNTGAKAQRWFVIEIVDGTDYDIVADFADEVVAVGEKLALAATVTADGKEVDATVAFTLDGAAITEFAPAKAGEYTIVATATVDGEVVTEKFVVFAEVAVSAIADAKQKSLNTAEIIFSDATTAAKVVADSSLLDFSYLAGELEVVDLIKKVEAKKDAADTVVVTVYNQFAADTTYKFAYAESSATFVGAKTDAPAYIKVVGGDVPAMTDAELAVQVFTADGVDITTEDMLNNNVTYKSENEDDCVVAGKYIYFFATGKSAVVTATYEMGWDDETGEEKEDLKAAGAYKSVDEYTYSNLSGYAKGATGANKDLSYSNNFSISLSDTTEYIKAKLTQTKYDGTAEAMYLSGTNAGVALLNKDGGTATVAYRNYSSYELSSTNDNVILVDGNGLLIPLKTGTATIVIKGVDANDANKKEPIGSVAVTVIGERKLSSFVASVSDKMLSAGLESGDADESFITVTPKDQFGAAYDGVSYTYELVNVADKSYSQYLDIDTIATDSDYNGSKDKIGVRTNGSTVANITTTNKIQQLRIKVTATDNKDGNNKKTYEVIFNVKKVTGETPASIQLVLDKTSVDMKLNKANTSDYDVTAKLVKKDSAGYDLGIQEFTLITNIANAVTANDAYSIYIQKNSEDHGISASTYITFADADANGKYENVKFEPVATSGSTSQIVKLGKDTYTFRVYKGNNDKAQPVGGIQRLVLSDSTEAIKVVVNNTTIEANSVAKVAEVLDFYRGGNKITDKITVTGMDIANTGALTGNKLFVKKLTVQVAGSEMSSNGDVANYYYVETVDVNQLFTIVP